MCPSRIINKKMMTVYGDKQSSFEKLLEKDSCSSIQKCIKLAKVCHLLTNTLII